MCAVSPLARLVSTDYVGWPVHFDGLRRPWRRAGALSVAPDSSPVLAVGALPLAGENALPP